MRKVLVRCCATFACARVKTMRLHCEHVSHTLQSEITVFIIRRTLKLHNVRLIDYTCGNVCICNAGQAHASKLHN